MLLPTYLERGLREEKDAIDQFLADFEKAVDRVEMEASRREQAISRLLISKGAGYSDSLSKTTEKLGGMGTSRPRRCSKVDQIMGANGYSS